MPDDDRPMTWDESGKLVPMDAAAQERLLHAADGAGQSNQREQIAMKGLTFWQRRRLMRHYSPKRIVDPYFLEEAQNTTGCPIGWILIFGLLIVLGSIARWLFGWL